MEKDRHHWDAILDKTWKNENLIDPKKFVTIA